MSEDTTLKVIFQAVDEISNTLDLMQSNSTSVFNGIKSAITGAGIAAAIAVITTEINRCIDSYEVFDTAISKVKTLADPATMKGLETGIKDLSQELGVSAAELSDAVQLSLSSGIGEADVLKFVADAQKLAVGGFTNITQSVDVLTTALNAYGWEASEAAKISDILIKTQDLGKGDVDEIAGSMSRVISGAAAAKIQLEDVGAAYAIMTAKGDPAAVATTNLNAIINQLTTSGTAAAEAFSDFSGMSFYDFIASGRDLGDAMQVLYDGSGNMEKFTELWTEDRAKRGAQALANSIGEFNWAIDEMYNSAGAADKNFNIMNNTLARTGEMAEAAGENARSAVGEIFAPFREIGNTAGTEVSNLVNDVATAFLEWRNANDAQNEYWNLMPQTLAMHDELLNKGNALADAMAQYGEGSVEVSKLRSEMMLLQDSIDTDSMSMNDFGESVKTTADWVDGSISNFNKAYTEITQQDRAIRDLMKTYDNLSSQEVLTPVDAKTLEDTTARLKRMVPELAGYLNGDESLTFTAALDLALGSTQMNMSALTAEAKSVYAPLLGELEEQMNTATTAYELKKAQFEDAINGTGLFPKPDNYSDQDWQMRLADEMNILEGYANTATDSYNRISGAYGKMMEYDVPDYAGSQEEIAQTAEHEADALNAVKDVLGRYRDEIALLGEEYDAVFSNIREGLEKSIGGIEIKSLFQQLDFDEELGTSFEDQKTAMQSQIDFIAEYNSLLEEAGGLGIDKNVLASMTADDLSALMEELESLEGADLTAAVDEYNKLAEGVGSAKDTLAGTLTELTTNFTERLTEIEDAAAEAIKEMDLTPEAYTAAMSTIEGYASGLRNNIYKAKSEAQSIANAIRQILEGSYVINPVITFNPGGVQIGQGSGGTSGTGGGRYDPITGSYKKGAFDPLTAGGDNVSYPASLTQGSSKNQVEHVYRIELAGMGSVTIDGQMSKEAMVNTMLANLKPVLMEIVNQEKFEEGGGRKKMF